MRRILVTGNAGSGKSTTAQRIASELGLPYHSLDRVVWQSGWKKTPREERTIQLNRLTEQERWVIDGVSFDVQAKADTVVFLDVRRRVSFWRVCCRNWRYLFRSRPELPSGCPEILIIPTLIKIIWKFPANIRLRILEQARKDRDSQTFFHVQSRNELLVCLNTLSLETLAGTKNQE